MHSDITKIIHESKYREFTIKIVERETDRKFLYFYVLDAKGGISYAGDREVTENDLSDLGIAVPKIKSCIDTYIAMREKWHQEELEKKKKMNWTGRTFKRGDFVHFKGNDKYTPEDTYVWTYFGHLGMEYYLIEHVQGLDMSAFINKRPFKKFGIGADGFEAIHSSLLEEGKKYLPIYCTEFQGETDELIMLKEK